jgi:hypothetical protein
MRKFPRMPKALLKPPPGFKKPRVADFENDMQMLGEEIAQDFMDTIIENIENNTYGFELAESTIDRKGSDVPMISTGELIEAIYREGTSVSVMDTPRKNGLTNLQLAMILEYGTKDKHVPGFPVWRFTYRDFKDEAEQRIIDFFENNGKGNNR